MSTKPNTTRTAAQAAVAANLGTDLLTFRGMTFEVDDGAGNWAGKVIDHRFGDVYDFVVPDDYPEGVMLELAA